MYQYYNDRVRFNTLNPESYVKNISLNRTSYFSGEIIQVTVWDSPSQTAWVGLSGAYVSDYPNNATGMWSYLETGCMNEPNTYSRKTNVKLTLTAHIRNVHNMTVYPLQQGEYKIVLFKDSGYTELTAVKFTVGGSEITNIQYSYSILDAYYKGTTSSTAWIGIYHENDL